uniref:Small cysteine-rich protein 8 n=1 Tax=Orbicella faveolata TaxID=48498 RepID=SCR8B_ORBFA|nr:RecName: Full=Small cysteine-rich protein 8; Short=Mfav-SCRiP8; Short=SCRiP8; Flags: Precursor [Orbicella faveolata]ACC86273.1 scleractinian cysteine-rich protein [Orbicella faveolata]
MAAKFHLCLLLIILGTITVQGARHPGKPHFFRRQPGSDCASINGRCVPPNERCPNGECHLQSCPGYQEKCCCPV